MKFVLMNHDLEEREIDISELSHSSEKTQELFREIIQIAQEEGSFSSEHTPYLIEAMRAGVDSLTIMVTKMDAADLAKHFSMISATKGQCRFMRNGLTEQPEEYPSEDNQAVFSFENLDMAAIACAAINTVFSGESQLYKLNEHFFLWLGNETEGDHTTADLETILLEFGQKHITNGLGQQYLSEHGDVVISTNAVDKLSLYHAG